MKKYLFIVLFSSAMISPLSATTLKQMTVTGMLEQMDDMTAVIKHDSGASEKFARDKIINHADLKVGTRVHAVMNVEPDAYFKAPVLNFSMPKSQSEGSMKMAWFYYVSAMAQFDRQNANVVMSKNATTKTSSVDAPNFIERLLNAYAEERPFTCFYGGWPTRLSSDRRTCETPWSSTSVSQYTACGASGVYRCNPVVFGQGVSERAEGEHANVVAQANTEAGLCVRASSVQQIVATCAAASATRLDAHLQRLRTTPDLKSKFDRYVQSIDRFCRGGGGNVNAACLQLNDRLAALRFHTKEEERVCRVLENPAASGSSCRAVKVACTQGGNSMVGYVRAEHAAGFPGSRDARVRGGVMTRELITSIGELVKTPCGGASEEIRFGDHCTAELSRNLRQTTAGGTEGCPSGLCSVFARCLPPDATQVAFTHNLVLTCDCSLIGGGGERPNTEQLRACHGQQFTQVTVQSPGSYGAPATTPGAVTR